MFTGCQRQVTTKVHMYEGPQLLDDQVAKLTCENREQTFWEVLFTFYPSSIHIKTVDGKDYEDFGEGTVIPLEVFVLPGPHTFGIKFSGPRSLQAGAIPALIAHSAYELKYGPLGTELEFDTKAGHEYSIRFKEKMEQWKGITSVAYWVEDVNTGEIVAGEKPPELEPDKEN
jgi:hypothetical protein